jgi:hypothetical protein
MNQFKYFFFVILILFANQLSAQYVNVKLNSTPVFGEEWIAMNPKNPNQIVAGTNKSNGNLQGSMGYYYTTNGGYNWSEGVINSTLAQSGSDPVVLVDTAGNFYYICVANWGIPPPNGDKLLCNKSTNGGMNWNNGTVFGMPYPKFNDMPMGCVDFSNSQYRNNIYVTWTLFDSVFSSRPTDSCYVYFTRSTNGGTSFSTPKRISSFAGNSGWDIMTPEGPVPCTGTYGEIYVCYPYNQKILFTRSTDGGVTWLNNEILASNQIGGWLSTFSPVITCDLSNSSYSGNVYICFSDLRNGVNDRDIWLIKSTDKGDHWSVPLRVNNDSPGHAQTLPWICVDEVTGYVWIVFYDGRNYPTGSRYDTYVARSTDGGSTFQNVKVSNSSTSTLTGFWLGDYIGISAYNNKVRPIWTTSVGMGNSNLWTAIIDTFTIGVQAISSEIPIKFSLFQNYPNPFNPTTSIKYQVKSLKNVKFIVYDIMGKEIETLVNEKQTPGTYEISWDGTNYPSGVYFYKLSTGDFTDTKKMLLIK